jgi:ELWxxDGT repeat protein
VVVKEEVSPTDLTNVDGTLYFEGDDAAHGEELWKSNGTAAGTVMVQDIDPGAGSSNPANLTNVNGTLYFTVDGGADGFELWKSNGTAAGTVMVKDIGSLSGDSGPGNLTNVNGTLYFSAAAEVDGVDAFYLWKSDGTSSGTDIVTADVFSPSFLTNVNGTLYFEGDDPVHGQELWKSDGAAAGTMMVKDIDPGSGSSSPSDLAAANGAVEFYAFDGSSEGLFRSDGTAAGTIELTSNAQDTTPIGVTQTPDGDFNGDSRSDILWQNASGQASVWEMNGASLIGGGPVSPNWRAVGPVMMYALRSDALFRSALGIFASACLSSQSFIGQKNQATIRHSAPNAAVGQRTSRSCGHL